MTDLSPCRWCKEKPVMQGNKNANNGAIWWQVKCVSRKCAMRTIETHRCGNEEEAARIWNEDAE